MDGGVNIVAAAAGEGAGESRSVCFVDVSYHSLAEDIKPAPLTSFNYNTPFTLGGVGGRGSAHYAHKHTFIPYVINYNT